MPRIDQANFYLKALSRYGIGPKALHWLSKERQYRRFEVLLEALPKDLSFATIVDAGCGFGDLYLFLQERGIRVGRYIGIEQLERFVDIARSKTGCEIYPLDILRDPLPKAHYYLCSGALNTLTPFESHLFIKRMLDSATKGVAFNLLYAKKQSDIYNYFDDDRLEAMLDALGACIYFKRAGYIPNDLTLGVHRCAASLE